MRQRRRVDWDEELRKTERIRRRGFFVSGLSFAVSVVFILGFNWLGRDGFQVSRKILFTFLVVVAMFLVRGILLRRERLRREREERDSENGE